MSRLLRISLLVVALLMVIACWPFNNPTPTPTQSAVIIPPLTLAVTAQPPTYSTLDQTITYSYLVTNTGTSNLLGPVTITDNKVTGVTCPGVNTTGNKDDNLNPTEAVTCTGTYKITQADISNGSMTRQC